MKIFLDIDIGDAAAFAEASAAHERAQQFLAAVGAPQLGLSSSLGDLDEEGAAMLLEAYAADKAWSAKGRAQAAAPPSLRAGRVVCELFEKEVPKTVENFSCLCTGERGLGKASKKPLHYKGNKFHRIVKGFCCQGGDVVKGDGSAGDSIYGGKFNDEKPGLAKKHDSAGLLSMANSGKNSNSSQFFFTLAPAPQCDGKHVVFGRVLEGLEVLQRIDAEAGSADGTPRTDVAIADCGVLA
ncbi:MAG: cyclophilin [Monoraphidium minutum]|nr:MAG: cyclophilin [Monoraphidium minutum]